MPKKSEIRCKESMHEIRVDWFYKNSNFSCLQWGMLSQKRSGKLDAKEKIYDTEIFPILEWQKIHFSTAWHLVIIQEKIIKEKFFLY